MMEGSHLARFCIISVFCLVASPLSAQDSSRFEFGFELNGHIRNSKHTRFPIPFPFPPSFLPPGETTGTVETTDAGKQYEFSRATVFMDYRPTPNWEAFLKLDLIDLYDRNPTSSDTQIDLDEIWVRYGHENEPHIPVDRTGFYIKFGKFPKAERQDDRNLESYGLVSTAFNRFEDSGFEAGVDLGKNYYLKGSYTTGNPVFFRDPNALAGDNGTPDRNPNINAFPNPTIKSGFPIFYDAEIEGLDLDSHAEIGLAAGTRWGDEFGRRLVNIMAFHYRRTLRDTVNLYGTFYGGDFDTLLGVEEELGLSGGLPLNGDDKTETGANVWVYFDEGTVFAQYVDQKIAGLQRKGWEVEVAWGFPLPLFWAFRDRQVFSRVTPVLRYSVLDPKFVGNGLIYPTPTVWWSWKKLDLGFNVQLYNHLSLTLEYADNQFERSNKFEHVDEFLATFRWKWRSSDL